MTGLPATESMALIANCALCGAKLFNISVFRVSTTVFNLYTCKA